MGISSYRTVQSPTMRKTHTVKRISYLQEIRILLVGHTGNGKSSTANTIIGKDLFDASVSTCSKTQECQKEETIRDNKKIVVIDTPGMFPTTESTNKDIEREIRKCVGVCLPGPHVILYVLRIGGRFTKEEENTINRIDKLFEKSYYNFVIFLFTNKEGLPTNKTLDEFLVDMPKSLKLKLQKAGNRKLAFKNVNMTPDENEVQLNELFTKIRQLGENVKYYTDSKLKKLAKALKKKTNMTQEEMRKDIMDEGESYDIIREKWYQLCYSPH